MITSINVKEEGCIDIRVGEDGVFLHIRFELGECFLFNVRPSPFDIFAEKITEGCNGVSKAWDVALVKSTEAEEASDFFWVVRYGPCNDFIDFVFLREDTICSDSETAKIDFGQEKFAFGTFRVQLFTAKMCKSCSR